MSPVAKAIWFIEHRLSETMTLDEIAEHARISRYHLVRIFGQATGHSVFGYIRRRRLTNAAKALLDGAPDILSVALDAGYNSNEAFTRAFRATFGATPEALRAGALPLPKNLLEPIRMTTSSNVAGSITPLRLETLPTLAVAGLRRSYSFETMASIPAQWLEFAHYIGTIDGMQPKTTYGVVFNAHDEGFDYLSGCAISGRPNLPKELALVEVPAGRYAVFHQSGHIATIRETCAAVWSDLLPASEYKAADSPWFERYPPSFNPMTGEGGFDICIPVSV